LRTNFWPILIKKLEKNGKQINKSAKMLRVMDRYRWIDKINDYGGELID
jgi:hypothetical protein